MEKEEKGEKDTAGLHTVRKGRRSNEGRERASGRFKRLR